MFNLPNRIYRLFSWIKTNQDHQNSLIVQEQLGNVVHQVVIESPNPVQAASNQNDSGQYGLTDESNLTTSFNLTGVDTNSNFNSTNNNNSIRYNGDSSSARYQAPSSLALLASNANVINSTSTQHNNVAATQINSGTRHNRRNNRRTHRHSSHRSSRSQSSHHSNNQLTTSTTSPSTLDYSLNLFDAKQAERNILSATCAVFCIAVLAVSLVEIRWFYLSGGGCNVNYVGVAHFFAPGRLESQLESSRIYKKDIEVYRFFLPNGLVLKNCATGEIMLIMRAVIAFVFLGIFSSCIGMVLDTFGCMRPGIKLIRRHGVFHILTVIFCLIINGFCFWISEKMYEQQNETRGKKGKKIDISFDVSYYLIVLASGLSILATAFTLMRRYPTDEDEQLERLLEEYTGFEEPVHLERSLPAIRTMQRRDQFPIISGTQIYTPADINDPSSVHQLVRFNNNDGNRGSHRHVSHSRLARATTPPPPATPPPSLYVNIASTARRGSNSELPPPYDPAPVVA